MRRGGVITAVLLLLLACAATAQAAYPGHDGLLAVEPLAGRGALLIRTDGHVVRRVCDAAVIGPCDTTGVPQFSPDGRELAIGGTATSAPAVVDLSGDCVNCELTEPSGDSGLRLGFAGDTAELSSIDARSVLTEAADGLGDRRTEADAAGGPALTSAVWSAGGELAAAGGGRVWIDHGSHHRLLSRGSEPAWSPGGTELAIVRAGWIWIVSVSSGRARRLVRGTEPAFSPNGRHVAFIGAGHRVMVVATGGGAARDVGVVTGQAVDWQPLPAHVTTTCAVPAGATVLAHNSSGLLTRVSQSSAGTTQSEVLGCLAGVGITRVAAGFADDPFDGGTAAVPELSALSGPYAAITNSLLNTHYGGASIQVQEVDLRTDADSGASDVAACPAAGECSLGGLYLAPDGAFASLAGEVIACPGVLTETYDCVSDAVEAWHDIAGGLVPARLDVTGPTPPSAIVPLSDLHGQGQVITWRHGSTPETATLP